MKFKFPEMDLSKEYPIVNIVVVLLFLGACVYVLTSRNTAQENKITELMQSHIIVHGTFCEIGGQYGSRAVSKRHNSYCYEYEGESYRNNFFREVPCKTSDESILLEMATEIKIAINPNKASSSYPILYPEDFANFNLQIEEDDFEFYREYLKCTGYSSIRSDD